MSAAANIQDLKGGNAHMLELLKYMKEGATELFDGMIAQAFECSLTLDELKENLDSGSASDARLMVVRKNNNKSAQAFRDVISECQKAVDESYRRYQNACEEAIAEHKRQIKEWEREKAAQHNRDRKINDLEYMCEKLDERGWRKLYNIARDLYKEECWVYENEEKRLRSEDKDIQERRDKRFYQASEIYQEEKRIWHKRIEVVGLIARAQGLRLDDSYGMRMPRGGSESVSADG